MLVSSTQDIQALKYSGDVHDATWIQSRPDNPVPASTAVFEVSATAQVDDEDLMRLQPGSQKYRWYRPKGYPHPHNLSLANL